MTKELYDNGGCNAGNENGGCFGMIWGVILACLVCALLGSCRTKYVGVPEYHKEYIHRTDSFFSTDTVKEKEWITVREVDSVQLAEIGLQLKGIKNAYLVEKNKNRERTADRMITHTDTILKTDSIRVPYPVVTNKVPFKDKVYFATIGIVICFFIVLLYKLIRWLRARSGIQD
ncbi:hypothetical protein [Prevotella sp. OH937_COT-195]|uniref:hypothetical protein n=1 Tax=Prevotella sp. OH937_COT-195 TaxID=2491051 RepID=UPI000F64F8F2|nr:hypothetical protein [Prevotella sp. OH937_COT-195]RRC97023.1 hypothetical protein EII32_10750 [Prevotella sp. OH937_COT-195]